MFKYMPTLLGFNNESLLEKKKNFDKVGIGKETLIKSPQIFAAPSKSFIFKYMLHYINAGGKQFLDYRNWYMTSEGKLWARYCYLQNRNAHPRNVIMNEKQFQKKYGVESKVLMEKYPISQKAVDYVNEQYNQLAETLGDEELETTLENM